MQTPERIPLDELTKALQQDRDIERKNLEALLHQSEATRTTLRQFKDEMEKAALQWIETIFDRIMEGEETRERLVQSQLAGLDAADGKKKGNGHDSGE